MEWETTKTQPNNPGADGEQSSHRSGKTNAPAERLELQIGELSNGTKATGRKRKDALRIYSRFPQWGLRSNHPLSSEL